MTAPAVLLGRAPALLFAGPAQRAYLDGPALAPGDVELLCAYAGLCLAHAQPAKAGRLVGLAAACTR